MHLEHWIDQLKIFYLLKCLFLHPCKYMYYIFLFRKFILFLFETWHQCNCRIGELFRISHSCQIYNCVRRYYNVFFVLYFVPFVNRQSKKWFLCSHCSNKNFYHQVETIYSWIRHELELLDRFLSWIKLFLIFLFFTNSNMERPLKNMLTSSSLQHFLRFTSSLKIVFDEY